MLVISVKFINVGKWYSTGVLSARRNKSYINKIEISSNRTMDLGYQSFRFSKDMCTTHTRLPCARTHIQSRVLGNPFFYQENNKLSSEINFLTSVNNFLTICFARKSKRQWFKAPLIDINLYACRQIVLKDFSLVKCNMLRV